MVVDMMKIFEKNFAFFFEVRLIKVEHDNINIVYLNSHFFS